MNLKKMWKRFWTMNVHNHEGFTLVELIIAIAVLAILSAVAVVGYSSYVKKTNVQADQTLFAEIVNAVTLGYYADTDGFDGGYIMLSSTGNATASTTDLQDALTAAFGDTWPTTLKLKCTDWTSAAYVDSSFHGQETELLGVVEDLTETLEELISGPNSDTLVGENFSGFLTGLNVSKEDPGAVADAAVLYVARDSSEMTPAQRQAVIDAMAGMLNAPNGDAIGAINAAMGGNKVVAACAAYYAIVEGYCRYANSKGYEDALDALNGAGFGSNPQEATEAVNAKVNAVMAEIMENGNFKDGTYVEEYFAPGGQAEKDAEAYLDVLNTVNSAQSDILKTGTLGEANFYNKEGGDLEKMFQQVANGGTLIFVGEDKEGQFVVTLPTRREG